MEWPIAAGVVEAYPTQKEVDHDYCTRHHDPGRPMRLRDQVRRLPVIDGHDLVGIVALADVAKALPDKPVGEVLEAISA
mgnify:FL=1|jgi:CBS domain-containing protein